MARMVRSFMHKYPRRDRGLRNMMAISAPIALLLMVVLVPIQIGSRATMAAPTGPLTVDGHVYDSTGSAVGSATVVVTTYNGTTFRAFVTTTSDSNGFYTVSFGSSDWDIGFTIYAVATKGGTYGQNQSVASSGSQTIDVKFGTLAIPELGGPAITALTVSALGMMVLLYARRRRSD